MIFYTIWFTNSFPCVMIYFDIPCVCLTWLALGKAESRQAPQVQPHQLITMKFQKKESKSTTKAPTGGKTKLPNSSLHGRAVQVSVDERVADLARRYPALTNALGSPLLEPKKRIRDFPASDQLRILHMVYALKKAAKG
jgi:hypothetical protein